MGNTQNTPEDVICREENLARDIIYSYDSDNRPTVYARNDSPVIAFLKHIQYVRDLKTGPLVTEVLKIPCGYELDNNPDAEPVINIEQPIDEKGHGPEDAIELNTISTDESYAIPSDPESVRNRRSSHQSDNESLNEIEFRDGDTHVVYSRIHDTDLMHLYDLHVAYQGVDRSVLSYVKTLRDQNKQSQTYAPATGGGASTDNLDNVMKYAEDNFGNLLDLHVKEEVVMNNALTICRMILQEPSIWDLNSGQEVGDKRIAVSEVAHQTMLLCDSIKELEKRISANYSTCK